MGNKNDLSLVIEELQKEIWYLKEKCRVLEAERDIFYNFYKEYFDDLGDEPDEN